MQTNGPQQIVQKLWSHCGVRRLLDRLGRADVVTLKPDLRRLAEPGGAGTPGMASRGWQDTRLCSGFQASRVGSGGAGTPGMTSMVWPRSGAGDAVSSIA